MRSAQTFFYVAAGILALAGVFHLGAQTAQGQAGSQIAGFSVLYTNGNFAFVTTPDGDVYGRLIVDSGGPYTPTLYGNLVYLGNFWDGPVQATETTWGRVKDTYR